MTHLYTTESVRGRLIPCVRLIFSFVSQWHGRWRTMATKYFFYISFLIDAYHRFAYMQYWSGHYAQRCSTTLIFTHPLTSRNS